MNVRLENAHTCPVAELGEGPGGPAPPLILAKKINNKIVKKRRRKKSRQGKRYSQINFASTSQKNRPPLAQGLDPPLMSETSFRLPMRNECEVIHDHGLLDFKLRSSIYEIFHLSPHTHSSRAY